VALDVGLDTSTPGRPARGEHVASVAERERGTIEGRARRARRRGTREVHQCTGPGEPSVRQDRESPRHAGAWTAMTARERFADAESCLLSSGSQVRVLPGAFLLAVE
jgi:hypothetical protein